MPAQSRSCRGKEGGHLQGRLGQRLHAHEPLLPHERLDHLAPALRARHAHRVRLLLNHQPRFLHMGCQRLHTHNHTGMWSNNRPPRTVVKAHTPCVKGLYKACVPWRSSSVKPQKSKVRGMPCHPRRTFMSRQSCLRASKRSWPSYEPAAAFSVASLFMMLIISRLQRCAQ